MDDDQDEGVVEGDGSVPSEGDSGGEEEEEEETDLMVLDPNHVRLFLSYWQNNIVYSPVFTMEITNAIW